MRCPYYTQWQADALRDVPCVSEAVFAEALGFHGLFSCIYPSELGIRGSHDIEMSIPGQRGVASLTPLRARSACELEGQVRALRLGPPYCSERRWGDLEVDQGTAQDTMEFLHFLLRAHERVPTGVVISGGLRAVIDYALEWSYKGCDEDEDEDLSSSEEDDSSSSEEEEEDTDMEDECALTQRA